MGVTEGVGPTPWLSAISGGAMVGLAVLKVS